jgi:RNA polymerase sigma-70 factor (ECF subfamily)
MPPPPREAPVGAPDHALVAAFRAGDEFAFVALYNRYKGAIYAYCAKLLLDREAAQDVTQEVFLRAYENRGRLVAGEAFRAWLYTVARNRCLNLLRTAGRDVPFEDEAAPAVPPAPFADLDRAERVALVDRGLRALPADYREVIVLREYDDLSYEEIAAATRSTVSAVKSRLFKARRKLGALLRPWLDPDPDARPAPGARPDTARRPAAPNR